MQLALGNRASDSGSLTLDELANFGLSNQLPQLSFDQAIEAFHLLSPHCRFIKTLPVGANVLDVGAGDGGLLAYRLWPGIARADLRIFAWAGEKDAGFENYDGYEVGRWPEQPPNFCGTKFDAIVSVNFLEHIDEPIRFVEWAVKRLTPRGSVFLEWPHPASTTLPTRGELAERGVRVACGNYHDGEEHRPQVPRLQAVRRALIRGGLDVEETAIARVPFVDEQLAIHARANNDLVCMTWAYWSFTGFCQYVVGRHAPRPSWWERLRRARAAKARRRQWIGAGRPRL